MRDLDSMSAAVREVIDAYPTGHEFYGNQLKEDVVEIYPQAVNMYPDTILRMARRHRRYAFCVVDQNNSLYKKVEVIPIAEQIKEVIPKPEPPVIRHSCAEPAQGFLFGFLVMALVFYSLISSNSGKTLISLSIWTGENGNILQKSEKLPWNSLSIPNLRHDTFNMPERVNKRQQGKPATERLTIVAKGVLYEDQSRENQRASK